MKKVLPVLLMLFAVAALACGGGDNGDAAARQAPEPQGSTMDEAAAEPDTAMTDAQPEAVPAEPDMSVEPEMTVDESEMAMTESESMTEPPSGGLFRRIWSDPPTLDPHLTSDTTSAGLVVELFSGLVAINTDLELVPDIAERWEVSPDGLVYTFYLRPNAKFHDGKPVTADDFKWSIERALNPSTASPVADTYLGDIVGAQDVIDGVAAELSGLEVIDDHTLRFTIDAPKAYFLAKLTYPTGYVVDRDNVESGGRNWADEPNGTGPFKLKEYRIGERIILERNPFYYRELAHLDTVVMNLAGGQSMAMYENDELDITGVSLFDIDRVLDPTEPLNQELMIAPPDFNISYIGFNTTMPPFDDANFRKALNHAVDKELIAREVLSELVVPAYGILPPGLPGYNPNLVGLRYDPELARSLLAQSKYAESRPRIVVTVPGTGGSIGLDLEVILQMWRDILDVTVEIQQVEWATYLEDLNQSKFQAYAGLGWEADYPDPQDFLDVLFHSESSLNHGEYANAEADAVLEEARVEPDVTKRITLYHQAEEIIVNDAAWVPLWFQGERHLLIKPYIQDYRVTPMILPKLRQVRIEG